MSGPAIAHALVATLFTAVATGAGTPPVLFARKVSARAQDAMLDTTII